MLDNWINGISMYIGLAQVILQGLTVVYIFTGNTKLLKGVISFSICYFASLWLFQQIPMNTIGVLSLWFFLLFINYLCVYKQKIQYAFAMGLLHVVYTCVIDYLYHIICLFMRNTFNINIYPTQPRMRAVIALTYVILFLLVRITKGYRIIELIRQQWRGLWIIYLLFFYFFMIPLVVEIERTEQSLSDQFVLYVLLMMSLFVISSFFYIKHKTQVHDMTQKLEMQEIYTSQMKKMVDSLRGFKHDWTNIINTIDGYVDLEDLHGIKNYIRSLTYYSNQIKTTEILNVELEKNSILYGILNYIHEMASMNSVQFEIAHMEQIDLQYCSALDFSRILGNLLDNALDAAKTSEERQVWFEINKIRDVYKIVIKNTCTDSEIDTEVIRNDGYTTKSNHSGIGLAQVYECIEKYKAKGYAMDLEPKYEDGMFTQILTI